MFLLGITRISTGRSFSGESIPCRIFPARLPVMVVPLRVASLLRVVGTCSSTNSVPPPRAMLSPPRAMLFLNRLVVVPLRYLHVHHRRVLGPPWLTCASREQMLVRYCSLFRWTNSDFCMFMTVPRRWGFLATGDEVKRSAVGDPSNQVFNA